MAVALLLPGQTVTSKFSKDLGPLSVTPNGTRSIWVQGLNASQGAFHFQWLGSSSLGVSLYRVGTCLLSDLTCVKMHRVAYWPSSPSGQYSETGHIVFPYLVTISVVANGTASWSGGYDSSSTLTTGTPLLILVIIMSGAVVLAILGGVAVFLGLFLRAGVYGGRTPLPTSPSADDVDHSLEQDELDEPVEFVEE